LLQNNDYLLSIKGNGSRTLLLLHTTPQGPAAFLFAANNTIYYNPITFPQPNNPSIFHTECLIDGEINIINDKPVFTAFDLIAIGGVLVTRRSLSTRLGVFSA
jgi:mRNA capping enzyme, catalytic domain